MSRPAALLVVVFLAGCAALAGSRRYTPEGEVIAENLLLPADAGIYRVYRVDQRGDTYVRYLPPDSLSGRLPGIDVLVYRARHSLDEEAANIRALAMQRDNSAIYDVDGTTYQSERPFVIHASGDTVYRAVIDMSIETTPHRQMLYLHEEAGTFVNVSTTFVRVRGTDLEPLFDAVVGEIIAGTRVAPNH